jgi:DNA mismatch endonuclease (patch repair protein)
VAGRIVVRRSDPLTKVERAQRMSQVRSRGNKSTEIAVERVLSASTVEGWIKHAKDVSGRPDFYFSDLKLAVFVDGCFWHACPKCNRRTPHSRRDFWATKIDENRRRDRRIRSQLRRQGIRTMRIWEHSVASGKWLQRLLRMIHEASRD